jgi:hypothetical protein
MAKGNTNFHCVDLVANDTDEGRTSAWYIS